MDIYTVTESLTIQKNYKEIKSHKDVPELEVGPDFFTRYGVEISPFEIEWFRLHVGIWSDFLENSDQSYAVVQYAAVTLLETAEYIEGILRDIDGNFHVFFPYDLLHGDLNTRVPIAFSRFGFFWGTDIYIISRNTISDLLLHFKQIRFPLDEQMLALGIGKEIKFICSETGWINYNQSISPSYISRNNTIKAYLQDYSAWSKRELKDVRKILSYLSELADSINVKIFLHAGTLLGSVRHGCIMPWDDDVDLMVRDVDLMHLIGKIREDNKYNVTEWIWRKTGEIYYKIWKSGGFKVEGYEYTFPFVDIWWTEEKEGQILTNDGYSFESQVYFPLKPVEFEGTKFYHPNKSYIILNEMYPGWDSAIKVFSWSHKYKNHSVRQMTVPIKTDQHGKFLEYK